MCYRDEQQDKALKKFEEKSENMPEFIRDYFHFLNSNNSKILYYGVINNFLEWLNDNNIIPNNIDNITLDDLQCVKDVHLIKYLNEQAKTMSPDTVDRKKNNISGFWNYLVEKEYVSKNIVNKSVSRKFRVEDDEHEIKVPTEDQLELMINSIKNNKSDMMMYRNLAIIKLFIGSGIRLDELVGLNVSDLHFDSDIPTITIFAKGKKKSRDVLISQTAIDYVKMYLEYREQFEWARGLESLFISSNKDKKTGLNKRISKSDIQVMFESNSEGNITPHMLRHYFATKYYNDTKDIVGLCRQLGHKDIKTTMKYYAKADLSSMSGVLMGML